MSKPKRQHWVPLFYLRYTGDQRNPRTPRVDFLQGRGHTGANQHQESCRAAYLYSPKDRDGNRQWSMDQKLTELEGTLASVWPLLANDFADLHGEEAMRKSVALFISVLHLRHPRRLS